MRRKRETISEDVFFENESASDEESLDEETTEKKKLRVAKEYLSTLRDEYGDDEEQLKLQIDAKEGNKLDREIADRLELSDSRLQEAHAFHHTSKWPLTSFAVSADNSSIYVVDKNGDVCHYDTETGTKTKFRFPRDFAKEPRERRASWVFRNGSYGISKRALVTCALSCDQKLLVVAGGDKKIHILDTQTKSHIKSLLSHQEAVSGLTFQKGTDKLFSCGYDRTVKAWNIQDFSYEDTFYGHQSEALDLDMMHSEKLLTVGNDRSCRIWKMHNDSQLVFRAPTLAMECCRFLNGSHFVSGSADGLQLWNTFKKKPIANVSMPYDFHPMLAKEHSWVQSLTTIHNTDLIASGAFDGGIRLWKAHGLSDKVPSLRRVGFGLEAKGFITSMHLSTDGSLLFGAQSRAPRLGDWHSIGSNVKNGIIIHRLTYCSS